MDSSTSIKRLNCDSYQVGWICPLEIDQVAAIEMLDEEHRAVPVMTGDTNMYHMGSINDHNIVIAGLPRAGNCIAAIVMTQMRMSFPNIKYCLMVGIGGGVPVKTDQGMIRLGQVVVSEPTDIHTGAVQYKLEEAMEGRFEPKCFFRLPTTLLHAAREVSAQCHQMAEDPISQNVQRIDTNTRGLRGFKFPGAENDHLYPAVYKHQNEGLSCQDGGCDKNQRIERLKDEMNDSIVVVHRGTIASGDLVMEDAQIRDRLAQQYGVLCFEKEAVGALTDFPCLIIRGIVDYCDSHKSRQWHGYAAAAAAAYARQLFFHMST